VEPRSPYHAVFGEAVKAIRKEAKLTQVEVAERMSPPTPATFVSDIERGVRNISLGTMLSLADALGVKLVTIINRADRLESRS